MSVKQKFFDSLVENWNEAYKWFSVQALALLTLIATLKEAFPDEWDQIISILPEPAQRALLPVVCIALIYARLKNQTKPENKNNGE
jgi:hypothetical protein